MPDSPTPFEKMVARAEATISSLRDHGATLKPGNRLIIHLEHLKDLALRNPLVSDTSITEIDQFSRAANAFEIWRHIAEAIRIGSITSLSKIDMALGGSLNPFDDSNQLAKSTEFELLILALLSNAGIQVLVAEPDLVITHCGIEFAIAAKRVVSVGQLAKRCRHGWKQIRQSKRPGILALDLSMILGARNGAGYQIRLQTSDPLDGMHQMLRDILDDKEYRMCPKDSRGNMTGLWVIVCLNYYLPSSRTFGVQLLQRMRSMVPRFHPWGASFQALAVKLQHPSGIIMPDSRLARDEAAERFIEW